MPNEAREQMIIQQFKDHLQFENGKYAKTLAFCRTQDHADRMCEQFDKEEGISATVLTHRYNKERNQRLKAFIEGDVDILFTVNLFDEGVDVPGIEAVMFLAGTKSPVKAIQQLGRGLRLASGKRDIRILDFIGNYDTLDKIINLGIITPGITKKQKKKLKPAAKKEAKVLDIAEIHIEEEIMDD